MTKKKNYATVILTAVCGLFAFVPTVDAAGWRVIAEDSRFPTDDVIVAFCSVTDSQYQLPADPSTSDCTPGLCVPYQQGPVPNSLIGASYGATCTGGTGSVFP